MLMGSAFIILRRLYSPLLFVKLNEFDGKIVVWSPPPFCIQDICSASLTAIQNEIVHTNLAIKPLLHGEKDKE